MLVVEIFLPSIGRTYECKLNEDIATHIVIEEISSVICQKEQCEINGNRADLIMVLCEKQQVLSSNLSLYENGVQSGDRLMLV